MVLLDQLLWGHLLCYEHFFQSLRIDHPPERSIEDVLRPADLEVVCFFHVVKAVFLAKFAEVQNEVTRKGSSGQVTHVENRVPLHNLPRQEHDPHHVLPQKLK